ncbi:MAG: nuclear transport factor 2 family protein [Methylobacteriaceae bacterium]|nr:nuclear transport factor 2 family protein [Methylobacteriaceae bacterium]
MAAFNSRDVERIMSHFADDCTFFASRGDEVCGQRIHGKEAVRKYLADRFKVIPDMRWIPTYDHVYDNKAVSVWMVKGTSANGEIIDAQGCDLWEFRGDKVLNKDTYWKIRFAK